MNNAWKHKPRKSQKPFDYFGYLVFIAAGLFLVWMWHAGTETITENAAQSALFSEGY